MTTNKIKYQEWKNTEKAQLDEAKAHDLKTHHFSLGIAGSTQETIITNEAQSQPISTTTTRNLFRTKQASILSNKSRKCEHTIMILSKY